MNRPNRPMPAPWRVRVPLAQPPRQSSPRPQETAPAARPGIAARWKPRDRVRAAGN